MFVYLFVFAIGSSVAQTILIVSNPGITAIWYQTCLNTSVCSIVWNDQKQTACFGNSNLFSYIKMAFSNRIPIFVIVMEQKEWIIYSTIYKIKIIIWNYLYWVFEHIFMYSDHIPPTFPKSSHIHFTQPFPYPPSLSYSLYFGSSLFLNLRTDLYTYNFKK